MINRERKDLPVCGVTESEEPNPLARASWRLMLDDWFFSSEWLSVITRASVKADPHAVWRTCLDLSALL